MAKPPSAKLELADDDAKDERVTVGLIMPISSTANHSERHWADIQTLLHRGIASAGFKPVNVWENSSTDRVSERIVANIFENSVVVADISDLNPNVMLELGMRLASKKPTIVVVNAGGTIPFDIRDFHALDYPADTNILGMERFYGKLETALVEKHTSYLSETYTPFLGKVIVDVISPQTREISADQAVLSKLDEIGSRVEGLESRIRLNSVNPRSRGPFTSTDIKINGGKIVYIVPDENFDAFAKDALAMYEVDAVNKSRVSDDAAVAEIDFTQANDMVKFSRGLSAVAMRYSAKPGTLSDLAIS